LILNHLIPLLLVITILLTHLRNCMGL